MFAKTSRYAAIPTAVYTATDGREITYVTLRVIPPTAGIAAHTVVRGDRLDKLAFTYLGDPELFWRICDANSALLPDDLVAKPGTRLAIPLGTR